MFLKTLLTNNFCTKKERVTLAELKAIDEELTKRLNIRARGSLTSCLNFITYFISVSLKKYLLQSKFYQLTK